MSGLPIIDIIENTPPLARVNATGETAQAAADFIAPRAHTLRHRVLELVTEAPATGEAIHAKLLAQGVQCVLYSVKPRLSELARQGLITDSGERGVSDSGKCRSIVWRVTTPQERADFAAAKAAAA